MLSEPMTLYKLMILYLLKQVNTALAEHRITEFFLSREYTSYFTLRQALAELCEAGLVLANSTAYGSRYTASPEGLETLSESASPGKSATIWTVFSRTICCASKTNAACARNTA